MNYSDIDILYLMTKDVPDYLQDVLYKGFCDLRCNVVDLPSKGSLHGIPHRSIFHVPHLLFNYPQGHLRKNPDLIILSSMFIDFGKFGTREKWAEYVLDITKIFPPTTKIIVLDSEDHRGGLYPNLPGRDYDAIFKRELFSIPYSNWYSINFSAVPEYSDFIPFYSRMYDVSFIATLSNPFRETVRDYLLEKANDLGLSLFVHVEKSPISRVKYLEVLSQSKTSISVSGAGKDCYRYWEIPAKGSVMIAEETGLCIENDYDSRHIFRFKDLRDLGVVLETIKNYRNLDLERMAKNSLEHTRLYHTPTKRAEYVLNKIFREQDLR